MERVLRERWIVDVSAILLPQIWRSDLLVSQSLRYLYRNA